MDKKEIDKILKQHSKWINGEKGGSRADLSGADLSDTLLDNISWLAYIGIVPDKQGKAYAYKLIDDKGEGIFQGGINYLEAEKFEVEQVDPDVNEQCSYGINLATFTWCLSAKRVDTNRLLMMEFNVKDAVCPIGSDGKFGVKKCKKIGECSWKGTLKE